eukprot:2097268-Amphidinium_carterae.2
MGANGSTALELATPPSRNERYSRILCNVAFSNLPGCRSAMRATLFESLKACPCDPDDERDPDDDPRLRRLLDRPLDLFLDSLSFRQPPALVASSCPLSSSLRARSASSKAALASPMLGCKPAPLGLKDSTRSRSAFTFDMTPSSTGSAAPSSRKACGRGALLGSNQHSVTICSPRTRNLRTWTIILPGASAWQALAPVHI